MKGIIYKATNIINDKCYIGKTVKSLARRKIEHISKNNQVKRSALKSALNKYGKENFSWEVLESCDIENLNEKEKFYILKYKSYKTGKGYNLTEGGDGASSGNLNPSKRLDVRMKLSRISSLFKHSEETKKLLRRKGKEQFKNGMPIETRVKISNSLKGHPSKKGKQSKLAKNYIFVSPKGTIVHIKGIRAFCRENNLDSPSMIKLSKGKLNSCKGWKNYV